MDDINEMAALEEEAYFRYLDGLEIRQKLITIADKIKRCDYTQARSDLLVMIKEYE